jgi:hypothetical protein
MPLRNPIEALGRVRIRDLIRYLFNRPRPAHQAQSPTRQSRRESDVGPCSKPKDAKPSRPARRPWLRYDNEELWTPIRF